MNTYQDLRDALPSDLPFGVRESSIGNVVVGNLTPGYAVIFGRKLAEALRNVPDQKNS